MRYPSLWFPSFIESGGSWIAIAEALPIKPRSVKPRKVNGLQHGRSNWFIKFVLRGPARPRFIIIARFLMVAFISLQEFEFVWNFSDCFKLFAIYEMNIPVDMPCQQMSLTSRAIQLISRLIQFVTQLMLFVCGKCYQIFINASNNRFMQLIGRLVPSYVNKLSNESWWIVKYGAYADQDPKCHF